MADLAPDDEYDCLVQPLLARLHRGADRAAISAYLEAEVADHFGLDPTHHDTDAVADRLITWWAAPAAPTGPPEPTPCPACGAGEEQPSDPEHRDGSSPCQTPAP